MRFEIEIEDVFENNKTQEKLYRVKGFNSLVFDESGLKKLKKCSAVSESSIYQKGLKAGKMYIITQLLDLLVNNSKIESKSFLEQFYASIVKDFK